MAKSKKPKYLSALTAKRLRQLLHYDPRTKIFTYLVSRGHIKAGTITGYLRKDGYRVIGVDGRQYLASRLAYLYLKGRWPPAEVDHENCITDDDRGPNIRAATRQQNNTNQRLRKDNKTGFKGVFFRKDSKKYRAVIQINGRRISLGCFDTAEEAHAAYVKAA